MDSYIFKNSDNEIGYYQKYSDYGYIYLKKHIFSGSSDIRKVDLSTWTSFLQNPSSQPLPVISKDPICREIGYYSWYNYINNCPDIVEAVKISDTGLFFCRTNRNEPGLYEFTYSENNVTDEVRAYNNITSYLLNIFDFIEPDYKNLSAFGNKIRELLILSCTEVEYLLSSFLKDNNFKIEKGFLTMKHYVKALSLLKLNQYEVKLILFPSLGKFSPFKVWDELEPSKTLPWYASYNAIKHNRGDNKGLATLANLINAVAAIHILIESQYGAFIFDKPLHSNYESVFITNENPTWEIQDMQAPLLKDDAFEWTGRKKIFDNITQ
ncbi:hypothetical protein [Sodalis sp. dw_96]|uniref:hypothetical protein n=1 Tax=Sodalis sp. dw_96 TaxID=2719794 RepID=UPI001BD5BD9A|nr:hypothetical protein [Sodalis sp. dw_96]